MKSIQAPYTFTREGRVDTGFGWTDGDVDHAVQVHAIAEQFGDLLTVVWCPDFDKTIAKYELSAEELSGCIEAIEEAFWSGEREACRLSAVRQRQGSEVAA